MNIPSPFLRAVRRQRGREREDAIAEEGSVEDHLMLACQSGSTHTVQRLMSEVLGLDIGMAACSRRCEPLTHTCWLVCVHVCVCV